MCRHQLGFVTQCLISFYSPLCTRRKTQPHPPATLLFSMPLIFPCGTNWAKACLCSFVFCLPQKPWWCSLVSENSLLETYCCRTQERSEAYGIERKDGSGGCSKSFQIEQNVFNQLKRKWTFGNIFFCKYGKENESIGEKESANKMSHSQ